TANAHSRGGYRIDDELLLTARYRSPAVIADRDNDDAVTTLDPEGYHPSCQPGQRLPHVRLSGGSAGGTSSLDLLGSGFTLLTTTDDPAWRRQAAKAQQAGQPVTDQAINTGTQRGTKPGSWARLVGSGGEPIAVLVRPDGHIAWCGTGPVVDLKPILRRIFSAKFAPR
ncbi:MAG TPA: hypothetical protein VGN19_01865, partial [Pedococcus sp.]|nr:hypothetical protein [Pedococcus sp.]